VNLLRYAGLACNFCLLDHTVKLIVFRILICFGSALSILACISYWFHVVVIFVRATAFNVKYCTLLAGITCNESVVTNSLNFFCMLS
jgi:hypothetical protein